MRCGHVFIIVIMSDGCRNKMYLPYTRNVCIGLFDIERRLAMSQHVEYWRTVDRNVAILRADVH